MMSLPQQFDTSFYHQTNCDWKQRHLLNQDRDMSRFTTMLYHIDWWNSSIRYNTLMKHGIYPESETKSRMSEYLLFHKCPAERS